MIAQIARCKRPGCGGTLVKDADGTISCLSCARLYSKRGNLKRLIIGSKAPSTKSYAMMSGKRA